MTVDDNRRVARAAFDALAAGDFEALRGLLASDAVLHQCGFLKPIPAGALLQGREQGARWAGGGVADRTAHLEQMIAEGDTVALRWRTDGMHTVDDSPDAHAIPVSFPCMTFLRVADGRIAEIWNMRDADTLQAAIRDAVDG